MSRAESAKKLQELLNDELCTLVACRQAMERVKEPATVAELRRIASRHEDSISHLRVAIIDRAEEPEDDARVNGPWLAAAKELGAASRSETILASFRKTEDLCRERAARAAATVGGLDETARRMVAEVILPRHVESLEVLDRFLFDPLGSGEPATPKVEPEMAATQRPAAVDAEVPEDDAPHLVDTIKGLAGQLAHAGLMVGIYGLAIATKPLRTLARKALNLPMPASGLT